MLFVIATRSSLLSGSKAQPAPHPITSVGTRHLGITYIVDGVRRLGAAATVQVGRSLHRGPPAVRGLIRVGSQRVQQVLNGLRDGRTRGMRLPHAGVSFTSSAKEVCLCFLWRKLWSEQCGEAGEEAAVKDASVEGQGSFLLRCARSCGRTALKTWPRGDAS